jgi:rhodanese-related sulfurtransferase
MSDYTIVPATEMKRIVSSGAMILDVRRPEEHEEMRLDAPHDLVTLDRLDPKDFMLRHGLDRDAPVYMLCRSGMRARKAADMFVNAGYKNLYVIEGGILACAACGEPVSGTGAASSATAPAQPAAQKKVIPLERQVRIAAGALVAIGTLLGHFLHPVFYLVSFGVGCGLVYAGITDNCTMAMILLKAPWNKSANAGSCSSPAPTCSSNLPKTPSNPTAGGCA